MPVTHSPSWRRQAWGDQGNKPLHIVTLRDQRRWHRTAKLLWVAARSGATYLFRTWVAVETYRRLPSHLTMISVHVGRYLHASRMQDCHCLKQHLVKHFIWFFPKGSGTLNGMVHAASVMAGDLLFPFSSRCSTGRNHGLLAGHSTGERVHCAGELAPVASV